MSAFAFYQALANGIITGCIYALVALSVVLIFKSTDAINFGGGEVVMFGAYSGMLGLVFFSLPYWLVFPFSIVVMFIVGALFERGVLKKVLGRAEPGQSILVAVVIATVGLAYALRGIVRLFRYTDDVRRLPAAFPGPPVELGPVFLQRQDIAIIVITVIAVTAMFLFFQYTFTGKALRGTSQNQRAAALVGIPVGFMRLLVWGIAFGLTGLAGVLVGGKLPMTPDMGGAIILLAFAAATIGGFTNLPGCIIGGIALGIIQNFFGLLFGSSTISVAPFVVIMVVLIVRPQGLFGGKSTMKKV